MKVCFVLPAPGNAPVGGFRVVYEYANWLSEHGHRVVVVHQALRRMDKGLYYKGWRLLRYFERRMTASYRPDRWFVLHPEVEVLWVPTPAAEYVPASDVIVATAWETAEAVASYPPDRGRKAYLIQDVEEWSGSRQRVEATWRSPMEKIVISGWLRREIERVGESATLIQNGLDTNEFGIDAAPDHRTACRIVMPWHSSSWKGSRDGLAALMDVHRAYPSVQADLFGVGWSPRGMPRWIHYHRSPSRSVLRAIYNRAAIFVGPSRSEGWGLPPCEAMLCGAAVSITDNPGHREYARHGRNALLSPVGRPELLAENVKKLISDTSLRLSIASAGAADMRAFTWERAGVRMERLLMRLANER